jgi:hypothetical protein
VSQHTLNAANQAIFHLQLSTNEAIRYVVKNTGADAKEASQAIKVTLTGYQQKS